MEEFQTNSNAHNMGTRNIYELRAMTANPSKYEEAECYAGIMLFTYRPPTLEGLNYGRKIFKLALKEYLLSNFCCIPGFVSTRSSQLL